MKAKRLIEASIKGSSNSLSSYDGTIISYENSASRYVELMKMILSGPQKDKLNFYRDMGKALQNFENEKKKKPDTN